MNHYYTQLAGALGMLKRHGADLPWTEINEKLRAFARENGPECDAPEIIEMHRNYRRQCIASGLISAGELFDINDAIPLVDAVE